MNEGAKHFGEVCSIRLFGIGTEWSKLLMSPPTRTPPDQTPNPPSPFSSKLTYNSISPILTRSCTLCEEELRARENLTVRKCNSCYKEVDGSNFYQQFCAGKFETSTEYFSVFLCTDCYNISSKVQQESKQSCHDVQLSKQQKYCRKNVSLWLN